jgi:hypothetical protein
LTEADKILNADGTAYEKLHYLIIAEDNPDTLDGLIKLFQDLARSRNFPVKFAVINAGNITQIRESGRPAFSIITSDGRFRPPQLEEVLDNRFPRSQAQRCLNAISRINVRGEN